MLLPRFNILNAIRFLSDAFYFINRYVPPLQQTNRLPFAWVPKRVSTFRLRVKFVLDNNVSICFDPGSVSGATVTLGCDAEQLTRVLIYPFLIKPFPGIGIVRRKEVKFLGVDTLGMAKWDYVSGQQEIERLYLVGIRFTGI
jgi:hypothetical protein